MSRTEETIQFNLDQIINIYENIFKIKKLIFLNDEPVFINYDYLHDKNIDLIIIKGN